MKFKYLPPQSAGTVFRFLRRDPEMCMGDTVSLAVQPNEIPDAAVREGMYEIREARDVRKIYYYVDEKWYKASLEQTWYLQGWDRLPQPTPQQWEHLKGVYQSRYRSLLSPQGQRLCKRLLWRQQLRRTKRRVRFSTRTRLSDTLPDINNFGPIVQHASAI